MVQIVSHLERKSIRWTSHSKRLWVGVWGYALVARYSAGRPCMGRRSVRTRTCRVRTVYVWRLIKVMAPRSDPLPPQQQPPPPPHHPPPRGRLQRELGRSGVSHIHLDSLKEWDSRFPQFLGPGCINFKNLCAHHQEEVLRSPKHAQLAKFGRFWGKLWHFQKSNVLRKLKMYMYFEINGHIILFLGNFYFL